MSQRPVSSRLQAQIRLEGGCNPISMLYRRALRSPSGLRPHTMRVILSIALSADEMPRP